MFLAKQLPRINITQQCAPAIDGPVPPWALPYFAKSGQGDEKVASTRRYVSVECGILHSMIDGGELVVHFTCCRFGNPEKRSGGHFPYFSHSDCNTCPRLIQ